MPCSSAQNLDTSPRACTVTHQRRSWRRDFWLLGALCAAPAALIAASNAAAAALAGDAAQKLPMQVQCLPGEGAFLRARLNGSINRELSWDETNLSCAGSVRPGADGLRLRFSANSGDNQPNLVLLFGITGLKEGAAGKALPVNLTIMVEGKGEFFATQGDNRCTIDDIQQQPINGIPLRQRAWRISARGFCTQPARALQGDGSVLVSRFDFVGRADFSSDEPTDTNSSTAPETP